MLGHVHVRVGGCLPPVSLTRGMTRYLISHLTLEPVEYIQSLRNTTTYEIQDLCEATVIFVLPLRR